MDDLVQLINDLVSTDSINPDLVAGGAGEGEIASFVAEWLTSEGLEVRLDEVKPGRPNVIAVARGTGGGRTLMLNGHLDTVGVAGMEKPLQPIVDNDRLYGRGAFDMKCGLAACMLSMVESLKQELAGDVIFTAVIDEEYAGLGTMDVAKKYQADAAIIAEPTDMELVIAHKGFVWLEVETLGVAAHGSSPDLGVDAIAKMGKVLVEIDALNQRLMEGQTHGMLGTGSIHASLITGGQELSSYPERCVLKIERRTIPGETPDFVESQIVDIVDRITATQTDFKATVHQFLAREPMETLEGSPLPMVIKRAATEITGRDTEVTGMAGWTDAASLAAAGIPSVLFGPRGAGAHAVEEWVDLVSVRQCVEIYTQVITEFCT